MRIACDVLLYAVLLAVGPCAGHPLGDMLPSGSDEDYIIGGVPSQPGKWPWMIAVDSDEYGFICGAALIDERWAVTAAHCVQDAPIQLYVNLGQYNKTARDEVQRVAVDIIIHPDYYIGRDEFDVALLPLRESANIKHPLIDVIQLPAYNQTFSRHDECWIIGWGRVVLGSNQPLSDVLMERNVSVMSNLFCQLKWAFSIFQPTIYDSNICVDEEGGFVSTCQGDSGSPLHCFDSRRQQYVIAGVSSWGSAACQVYPSVFVRVSSYRAWIDSHIRPNPAKETKSKIKSDDVD